MAKQLSHNIVGRTVRVFVDPITRKSEEGIGTVKEILQTPEQTGVEGQYAVKVSFISDGEEEQGRYLRFINVGDVFGL